MHVCSSLLISCIDFRIQRTVEDWARKNLGDREYDRVALAGGVKNRDVILSQVDISVRLHQIKKVVLMNHEDCGAYLPVEKRAVSREQLALSQSKGIVRAVGERQAKAGGDEGTEEKHKENLSEAAEVIRVKYPALEIQTYYVKLDGSVAPTA